MLNNKTKIFIFDVGEVSDIFAFFSEIFATTPVSDVNTCVPDRTQRALSNGTIGFYSRITNNKIRKQTDKLKKRV